MISTKMISFNRLDRDPLKANQSARKWPGVVLFFFLINFVPSLSLEASTTVHHGNTTITWNIENISPATIFTPANNCRWIDNNPTGGGSYYYCEYIIWDPPADKEVILTSSVTSTTQTNHYLDYIYKDQATVFNQSMPVVLSSHFWSNSTLTNRETGIGFFFWTDDLSYEISYNNDASFEDRIIIEIKPGFSDPTLYEERYGKNKDTCFCDSSTYPERPGIKHCAKRKKGSGPGL